MVSIIFTLDYEIYGNGHGSLQELVLEPTRRLADLFQQHAAPFVVFVEALEFAKMEEAHSDPAIADVRAQLRSLRDAGHEIGLHLHPWWANAHFADGAWTLDWSERSICALPAARIDEIVTGAIQYLRQALGDPDFTPVSFRGGLWLMQPTEPMATVLARHGVRIDSSVFKGGRTYDSGLDYRPALKNGSYWRFSSDVNVPDASGPLLEVPIHTEMVPFWKMLGRKRLQLHKKMPAAPTSDPHPRRWRDFLRWRYPRKFDFCRMTLEEMRAGIERALRNSNRAQGKAQPIVAIGHSKDLVDFDAVGRFLEFLSKRAIAVTTYARLLESSAQAPATPTTVHANALNC